MTNPHIDPVTFHAPDDLLDRLINDRPFPDDLCQPEQSHEVPVVPWDPRVLRILWEMEQMAYEDSMKRIRQIEEARKRRAFYFAP